MRLTAFLSIPLLLVGCAAKVTVPIAAGADLVTTEIGLHQGGVEINPVMQSSGWRIALKAATTALIVWLCDLLDKRGDAGWSDFLQWLATGVWGGAAAWNLSQLKELP